MIRPKRFFSVFAMILALIMLFSVLYIALESDHDCCGEGCAVCAQLQACEDLLRNLLLTTAVLTAAGSFCVLIFFAAAESCGFIRPRTLTALKVKLSD